MSSAEAAFMHDEPQTQQRQLQLNQEQVQVLRKHLARETMSLDDAAILLGVPVNELAQHFQGRRAAHVQGLTLSPEESTARRKRRKPKPYIPDENNDIENAGLDLHAPKRWMERSKGGGKAIWAGGILAGVVLIGGLALLSGIPQSLLFAPRGVSEQRDAAPVETATAEATGAETPISAEAPVAAPVDPVTAEGQPEAVADPAADPNAVAAAADPNAAAEAPLPSAPEEVAPAVAEGQEQTVAEAPAEAPPLAAPAAAAAEPLPAPEAAPVASAPAAPAVPPSVHFATRPAAVRDAPTVSGSATLAQLKRGETVSGSIVPGADGKSSWLKIENGAGAGGYVSARNISAEPRPNVAQALGQTKTLTQAAALHSGPDENSQTLDTLQPGISVLAAAEVAGGWIEIHRRAGGVGYIRKEAFQ